MPCWVRRSSLLLNVTQVLNNRQYASFNNRFGIARKIKKQLNTWFIHLGSRNLRSCVPPVVNFPSRDRRAQRPTPPNWHLDAAISRFSSIDHLINGAGRKYAIVSLS